MTDMITETLPSDAGGSLHPRYEGRDPVKMWLDEHWIITMLMVCAAVTVAAAIAVGVVSVTLGGV